MISNSYAIIFDLDGTLVHSIPDMHIAINKTLNEYHLQNISEEKLQTFVGEGMLSLSKEIYADILLSQVNIPFLVFIINAPAFSNVDNNLSLIHI